MRTGGWSLLGLCCVLIGLNSCHSYVLRSCTVSSCGPSSLQIHVDCSDQELHAAPPDVPRRATSLDLSGNLIRQVRGSDLRGLTELRHLDLSRNHICGLEDSALEDLVQLRRLDLDFNALRSLTGDLFVGLTNLTHLSLFMNRIAYVSAAAVRPLVSLETLSLRFNDLRKMADVAAVFRLSNLRELDLAQNNLPSFRSDDLPVNVSSLRVLNLNSNPLRKFSVSADVFPRLRSLHFSDCHGDFLWDVCNATFLRSLTALHLGGTSTPARTYRSVLRSVESLRYLSLSFMKEWLGGGLLDSACGPLTLTGLDLRSNFMDSINDTLLRRCSGLERLNLGSNVLKELSPLSLTSVKRLRHLDLSANRLSRVPAAIGPLSDLLTLNLSYNLIAALSCWDFQNLSSLTELDLDQNHVFLLRGCMFRNLQNLRTLRVAHNNIYTIHDAFRGGQRPLQLLDLRGNGVNKFHEGDFAGLSSLRSLSLQSGTFSVTPNGTFDHLDLLHSLSVSLLLVGGGLFSGLSRLQTLTIHQSLEPGGLRCAGSWPPFSGLLSLKRLSIRNSKRYSCRIPGDLLRGLGSLEHFTAERFSQESLDPNTFADTPGLMSLDLLHTDLQEPDPWLFAPIPNLRALNLSGNHYQSLDFLSRSNLSMLRSLTLRDNKVTSVDAAVFHSLPSLVYLDLLGNPFSCDCTNVGFIQWVKSGERTQVVNAHHLTCSYPRSQKGALLLDFDAQSCGQEVSIICFLFSSLLVLLTLLASFIYHFLRWQIVYAFHLFLAFLYDQQRRRTAQPYRYDAFVSYNVADEAWVFGRMLPELEDKRGWRLCLHHRDFIPGKTIIDNMTEAVYSSRKTLCVLSRAYLQSEWCSREIHMASFRLFDEQKDVLVLLLLEDIPSCLLSPYHRMRKLMKRKTYLKWPQDARHANVFWQNVGHALETGDDAAAHGPQRDYVGT